MWRKGEWRWDESLGLPVLIADSPGALGPILSARLWLQPWLLWMVSACREHSASSIHCPLTFSPLFCLKVLSKAPRSFQAGVRSIKSPSGTPQERGDGSQWIDAPASRPLGTCSWRALLDPKLLLVGVVKKKKKTWFWLFLLCHTLLHAFNHASWGHVPNKLPALKSLSQTTSWKIKVGGERGNYFSVIFFFLHGYVFICVCTAFLLLHRSPRCWQWLSFCLPFYGCPTELLWLSTHFSPILSKKTGSCSFAEFAFISTVPSTPWFTISCPRNSVQPSESSASVSRSPQRNPLTTAWPSVTASSRNPIVSAQSWMLSLSLTLTCLPRKCLLMTPAWLLKKPLAKVDSWNRRK